jgi:hypothetical protein
VKKQIAGIITVMLAFAGVTFADGVWADYDGASPFIVRYMDADDVGTITLAATAVTCVDDGNSTAISLTPTLTLAELVAAINACTNATGTKNFEAKMWAGVSADTVSNQIVAVSATTLTKTWSTVAKWDTSVCLHYDVVANGLPFGPDAEIGSAGVITGLYGEPAGTGNRTVSVYVNGSRKFYQTFVSPFYVPTADSTVNVVNATFDASTVDLGAGIPVGKDYVGFARVACATTATTGGLGLSIERPRP